MKRLKYVLPILAVVIALMSVFAFSDKKPANEYPKTSTATLYYFQYNGTSFGESDFEMASNWVLLGTSNPGDICDGANNNPCVVPATLEDNLNTTTGPTAFAAFLSGQGSATTYVTTNATALKP